MSLEADIKELRLKQKTLDSAFSDMMRVIGGTHEVATLILKEQLDLRKELIDFKSEVNKRFDQQAKHANMVEETLIQIINRLPG